jgi:hypothetical protein
MQPPCGFAHHDEPASDVCGWAQHWAAHGATALSAEDVAVYERSPPPDILGLLREQNERMIGGAFERVVANWGAEYETAFGKSLRGRVSLVFPTDVKLYGSAGQ